MQELAELSDGWEIGNWKTLASSPRRPHVDIIRIHTTIHLWAHDWGTAGPFGSNLLSPARTTKHVKRRKKSRSPGGPLTPTPATTVRNYHRWGSTCKWSMLLLQDLSQGRKELQNQLPRCLSLGKRPLEYAGSTRKTAYWGGPSAFKVPTSTTYWQKQSTAVSNAGPMSSFRIPLPCASMGRSPN